MSTENKDVKSGIANGTTGKFRHAVLKEDRKVHPMRLNGIWVNAIDADDVDHLRIEFFDCKRVGSFKVTASKANLPSEIPTGGVWCKA